MELRKYNIFFHLHTVTGIIICVALYIIFFAGAFSLFKDEIHIWEENKATETGVSGQDYLALSRLDYDRVLDSLAGQGVRLSGRNIGFMMDGADHVGVYVSGSTDKQAAKVDKERADRILDLKSYRLQEHEHNYSFGELLYFLHFFYQLGSLGYCLAGFIALLFLFSIISGILIHWDKIITNFFIFRPWSKWKIIWTDLHTSLGVYSLPYQLMYAITGAYFCLNVLAASPSALLYQNDMSAYYKDLELWPQFKPGKQEDIVFSINDKIKETTNKWAFSHPTYVSLSNYGNSEMHLQVDVKLDTKERLLGYGTIIFNIPQSKVVREINPYEEDYASTISKIMYMLHFGYFKDMIGVKGDYALRLIYFLLAIVTAVVIVSGLLVWVEARTKKNIDERQRKINYLIGRVSLAICLAVVPITLLTFLVSRYTNSLSHDFRESSINWLFFVGWFVFSAILFALKTQRKITSTLLWVISIIGLLFPLLSGSFLAYSMDYSFYGRASIDLIWVIFGIISLYALYRRDKSIK